MDKERVVNRPVILDEPGPAVNEAVLKAASATTLEPAKAALEADEEKASRELVASEEAARGAKMILEEAQKVVTYILECLRGFVLMLRIPTLFRRIKIIPESP